MTYLAYKEINFRPDRLLLLQQAVKIIAEYQEMNMALTVRQLHYQFVSRDIYKNTAASYNMLSRLISDGRLAGLVSWTAIEDRVRSLQGRNFFADPLQALTEARDRFLLDRWKRQPMRFEVWCEKDALSGVIGPVCHDLCIDHFATRGYSSQSAQWEAGQRLQGYVSNGQIPIILHLGDHDPSGIDMTRDNRERLEMFAGVPITVVRIALNMDQIEQYNPPPNFAKSTDPRFEDYQRQFDTGESWEVDALDPRVIARLIREQVLRGRNEDLWNAAIEEEKEQLDVIDTLLEQLRPPSTDQGPEELM